MSQEQHRAVTPQTTPSESPPPSKKRRVSFVEPSLRLNKETNKVAAQWNRLASLNGSENTPEQESTQPEENVDSSLSVKEKRQERRKQRRRERQQKAAETESSKESTPAVEDGTPKPDAEKEKKKKRKKDKKALENDREDETTVTPEPQPAESVDKAAKAKLHKVNGINDAATDDTAAAKKSKKRSRTTETDSMDKLESGKATTPNSSAEPPPETEKTEEASRSAKKQKHAHKDGVNAGADGANKKSSTKETNLPNAAEVPPPKTPKKSKIKSPAIITSEEPVRFIVCISNPLFNPSCRNQKQRLLLRSLLEKSTLPQRQRKKQVASLTHNHLCQLHPLRSSLLRNRKIHHLNPRVGNFLIDLQARPDNNPIDTPPVVPEAAAPTEKCKYYSRNGSFAYLILLSSSGQAQAQKELRCNTD